MVQCVVESMSKMRQLNADRNLRIEKERKNIYRCSIIYFIIFFFKKLSHEILGLNLFNDLNVSTNRN